MADVRPFPALHYNLDCVSSLGDVTAPPYDVIDAGQRAELLARSPFNVVEIDLPQTGEGGDPYEHAAETIEEWTLQGVLAQDREPLDLGADPGLHRPRRRRAHPPRHPRPGRGRGLRPRAGAPARAHPARPEAGPPRPHPRHPLQPLADLLPLQRATPGRWSSRATEGEPPGARSRDDDGTVHRVWRVTDPAIHEAVADSPRRRRAADRRRPPPLRDRPRLHGGGRRRGRTTATR